MTDGITEAMRDTADVPPSKRRQWVVCIDRNDDMERRFEVDAVDVSSALRSALIRGSLEGAEVMGVRVWEAP